MVHPSILDHATVLKRKFEETIKKEVALNLLEDLLTLFTHIRSFHLTIHQQQAYKIHKNRIKARSHRKTL